MAQYENIIVEGFIPENLSGRHGEVHIRPIKGQQPFSHKMFV